MRYHQMLENLVVEGESNRLFSSSKMCLKMKKENVLNYI